MNRPVSAAVTLAFLGASLIACGDDTPAVCESADDLQASYGAVKEVDLTQSGALDDLKTDLASVKTDLGMVKADATSEFDTQIKAVTTAYDVLEPAVDAAVADPSAATLAAVAQSLASFGTAVQALIDDVEATC